MTRYTMSQARAGFAQVLDAAEQGETILIERKGTRFVLVRMKREKPNRRPATIEVLDRALLEDDWTWRHTKGGLVLVRRRKPA